MSTQWPFLQLAGSSHSFTSAEQHRFSPEDSSRGTIQGQFISPTYYCSQHTLLLVGVWDPRRVAVAQEGALGVDAVAVGAQRLVVALVHICGSGEKVDSHNQEARFTAF